MYKLYIYLLAVILSLSPLVTAEEYKPSAIVTYISSEVVYINAGSESGLKVGDTLKVFNANKRISLIEISMLSAHSSATKIIQGIEYLQVGSLVQLGDVPILPSKTLESEMPVSRKKQKYNVNRFTGNLSLRNVYHHDLSSSDLTFVRPQISLRLKYENISNSNITFILNHSTRLNYRDNNANLNRTSSDWNHRLYTFALVHDDQSTTTAWALGRVVAPYVRGVGFIDGGYIVRSINENWKAGIAGGSTPNRFNSDVELNHHKAGLFLAYETGDYTGRHYSISTALATEYAGGTVSRDFIYLQATFAESNKFNTYHSVEVDVNRHWRYSDTGERLTFTNYYGTMDYSFYKFKTSLSYDSRQRIRYIESRNLPDSLFDETTNRGVRASIAYNPASQLRVRTSGGIRFREDRMGDIKSGTVMVSYRKLFTKSDNAMIQINYVTTFLTDGIRTFANYNFYLNPQFLLRISTAYHQYKTNNITTANYYYDLGGDYALTKSLSLNGSFRHYLDLQLKSIELYTDITYRW